MASKERGDEMKALIWTVAGVLAALWTGASALVAALLDWTGAALQQAAPSGAAAAAGAAPLPAWLAGWVDPAAWAALAHNAQAALDAGRAALPYLGSAAGWLEPLVWLLWGLGIATLLVLGAGSHWLLARRPAAG